MAKKATTKKTAAAPPVQGTTTAPAPSAAPLPVLGDALPPDIFPDPTRLPGGLQPGELLLPTPPVPTHPLLPAGTTTAPQARPRRGMVIDSTTGRWRALGAPSVAAVPPVAAQQTMRRWNPTFDPPPPEVTEARNRALALRNQLHATMQSLIGSVAEIDAVLAYVSATPEAGAEFERLGVSLAEVQSFRTEAMDVINLFKPEEEQQ